MTRKAFPFLPDRPTLDYERRLWRLGFGAIAGLDEAGRGAWAGPVTAAAVILPQDDTIYEILEGVRDSKMMTAEKREASREAIEESSAAWAVGFSSEREIDSVGIVSATRVAMRRAMLKLKQTPQHLIIDYLAIQEAPCPQICLPFGDRISLSVAAASVLAKTYRDAYMIKLEGKYPGYGFSNHKGYGTPEHRQLLKKNGISAVHRRSYRPVFEVEG